MKLRGARLKTHHICRKLDLLLSCLLSVATDVLDRSRTIFTLLHSRSKDFPHIQMEIVVTTAYSEFAFKTAGGGFNFWTAINTAIYLRL